MIKIKNAKRLVVKVGSSILINAKSQVNGEWLAAFAQDVSALIAGGTQVIIVTSGAVALGKQALAIKSQRLKLEEKQAAAACGQIMLMQAWRESLLGHNIAAAQILLTIDDSEDRRRYLNARSTLETLLSNNVIPIINENDTVATAELRFGDNDRLAARVAQMASADILVLLSDIDGLYTANPNLDKTAKLVEIVKEVTPDIEAMAGKATSQVGTGGMITKLEAAKIALAAGCHMIIAKGKKLHALGEIDKSPRTCFVASSNPHNARKSWISGAILAGGSITIDDGALQAVKKGKSLLPAGVKIIEGFFERGDAVNIKDISGNIVGKGLIAYSAEDSTKIIGNNSSEIEAILGFKGRTAIMHRDDLVLKE